MKLGDLPTWIAAVGTVGALFAALRQIQVERQARQGAERALSESALRAQAETVSGWYGGQATPPDSDESSQGRDWLVVLNRSHEPVYQAVATLVFIQGTGPRTGEAWVEVEKRTGGTETYRSTMGVIPPGRWRTQVPSDWGHMQAQPAVEVAFTDRAGNHWIRRSDGTLSRIPISAVDYYQLVRPRSFENPSPYPTD
jgi:hypothetical protein